MYICMILKSQYELHILLDEPPQIPLKLQDASKVNILLASVRAHSLMNGIIVPLKQRFYGVDGDLIVIYPKPYSIYLRGTLSLFWKDSASIDEV